MELRIKDLESELSKVKTLQEDSHKAELEKYKQLCFMRIFLQSFHLGEFRFQIFNYEFHLTSYGSIILLL